MLDLHTRNLAFKMPNLDSLNEQQFYTRLGRPETALVSRTDGRAPGISIPNYFVRPTTFGKCIRETLRTNPTVKIIDFGESFQTENAPTRLHTPLVVRAPECLFSDQLDYRVDLWSMACLVMLSFKFQRTFDTNMRSFSSWSPASHHSMQLC